MIAAAFLGPSLLWFTPLVAVPVLIYLWNRQRHRPVPWAAMAFILRAVATNRRRLRIENLLLLLLRILAILLLVLAFSQPVVRRPAVLAAAGDGPKSLLLVVDASTSMRFGAESETAFDRARAAAGRLVKGLARDGDRVGVIVGGQSFGARGGAQATGTAQPLYGDPVYVDAAGRRRIEADLRDLRPGARPLAALDWLQAVIQFLPRFDRLGAEAAAQGAAEGAVPTGKKHVFVLTDLQRSQFGEAALGGDEPLRRALQRAVELGAEVVFLDCGEEGAQNVAVTDLQASSGVVATGQPVRLTATVQSFSAEPLDLELTLSVDGERVRDVPLTLLPGAREDRELYAVFDEPGSHTASVELRTDQLMVDNRRYLTLDVRQAIRCALIDGEPAATFPEGETDALEVALAPGSDDRLVRELIRPQSLTVDDLEALDLQKVDVLVLANVASVPSGSDLVERIEAFVRQGGGLLVFSGPALAPATWNKRWWKDGRGLLPARIGAAVERPEEADASYFRLEVQAPGNPVLRPFASRDAAEELRIPRFHGFSRLDLGEGGDKDPTREVLLRFDELRLTEDGREVAVEGGASGLPALVERRFGRGRVLLFASTADGQWSNFFAQYGYLMLWQRAVQALAEQGSAERNLLVGEPFTEVLPSSDYVPEVLLTTPGQETLGLRTEVLEGEDRGHFRIAHRQTDEPGVYELAFVRRSEGGRTETVRSERFSVNVDPRESDLSRTQADELKRLFPGLPLEVRPVAELNRLGRASDGGPGGLELWSYLLWAALALLVAEAWLAQRCGRQAR